MLRDMKLIGHFADGAKRTSGLFKFGPIGLAPVCGIIHVRERDHRETGGSIHSSSPPSSPEGGVMWFTTAFRTWLGRNTRTRRGRIGTSMPVFGFRPTRRPFCLTEKVP